MACLGTVAGDVLALQGMTGSPERLFYAAHEGPVSSYEEIAERLAEKLKEKQTRSPN